MCTTPQVCTAGDGVTSGCGGSSNGCGESTLRPGYFHISSFYVPVFCLRHQEELSKTPLSKQECHKFIRFTSNNASVESR